jgi:hypothetical protein
MSFPRHPEIYPPMEAQTTAVRASSHRLDEFPAGYSLAGCSPAWPASASPAGHQYALQSFCRSRIFQRTANSVLTVCVSRGGKRNYMLIDSLFSEQELLVRQTARQFVEGRVIPINCDRYRDARAVRRS